MLWALKELRDGGIQGPQVDVIPFSFEEKSAPVQLGPAQRPFLPWLTALKSLRLSPVLPPPQPRPQPGDGGQRDIKDLRIPINF